MVCGLLFFPEPFFSKVNKTHKIYKPLQGHQAENFYKFFAQLSLDNLATFATTLRSSN